MGVSVAPIMKHLAIGGEDWLVAEHGVTPGEKFQVY